MTDEYIAALKNKIEELIYDDFGAAEKAVETLLEYDSSKETTVWIAEKYKEYIEVFIYDDLESLEPIINKLLYYDNSQKTKKWAAEKYKEIALELIEEENFKKSKEYMEQSKKLLKEPVSMGTHPQRHCPSCGEIVPEHAKFCGKCGAKLNDKTKIYG